MKQTKIKAFTLVELIVVITILAILGTLGLVSFFGYQLDARNGKRTSDLRSLHTQMELLVIQGAEIASFLSNTGSTLIGSQIAIGGFSGATNIPGLYAAGDINYNAIKVPSDDFLDPEFEVSYKMGYSSHLQTYQLAATIGLPGGDYDIDTSGSYVARKGGEFDTVRVPRVSISGNTFFTDQDPRSVGLQVGDRVGVSTGVYIITNIKADKVIVDSPITPHGAFLFLKNNESRYLIKKWDSNFPIDTNKGHTYVPYYSN